MVCFGEREIGEFPILLAPMEDVTDPPFRYFCKLMGADVVYTEFISSEGLIRDAAKSVRKLDFEEMERPVGIQIFGHDIDSMIRAVRYAEKANPDLIDINFGCPVKKVVAKGAGAGILKDIPKMVRMTKEVVKATHLPVTVKTRLGYDKDRLDIVEIAEKLQDVGIKALSIHARTRTMKYSDAADWTLIGKVKENQRMHIPIIGNGDIISAETAMYFKETYGVDGLMIGRAACGNPWIFKEIKHYLKTGELLARPDIQERVNICRQHLQKAITWKQEPRAVKEMRKHYTHYFKGYPNFKNFRLQLMQLQEPEQIFNLLGRIAEHYAGTALLNE